MIRAGDLDRRISIQRATLAEDPTFGEMVATWSTVATVSAAVRQVSGREFLSAEVTAAERRAVFVIRYRADVLTTDRVVYLGHPFDIREVREIGRREGLEIHAEAVA